MQLLMEQSQVHGHIRRISPTSVSYASSLSIHACLHFCRLSQVKVVAVCYEGNENSMGSFIRDIRNIYDLVYSAAAGGPLPFMVTDPPPVPFGQPPPQLPRFLLEAHPQLHQLLRSPVQVRLAVSCGWGHILECAACMLQVDQVAQHIKQAFSDASGISPDPDGALSMISSRSMADKYGGICG
jgi:hypothetical protein